MLCNYDSYNKNGNFKGQQKGLEGDSEGTGTGQRRDNKKNKEEESKEIREPALKITDLEKRKKSFYDSLVPYVDTYGKAMVKQFYDYWTEPNKSGTKFKMELEDTWSLQRRLTTWEDNNHKFGKVEVKKPVNNHDQEKRSREILECK